MGKVPYIIGEALVDTNFRQFEKAHGKLRKDFDSHQHSIKNLTDLAWKDIRVFGAKANDVNKDNTVAINEALDGGGYILIPDGTWWITGYLNIPDNTLIFFTENAVLKLHDGAGVTSGTLAILTNASWANGGSNITIIGAKIDGNHAGNPGKGVHGMIFKGVSHLTIRDAYVHDCENWSGGNLGDGIYMCRSTNGNHMDYVTLSNIRLSDNIRNGLAVIDARFSSFHNVKCYNNHNYSIDVEPNGVDDRLVQVSFSNINIVHSSADYPTDHLYYGMVLMNKNRGQTGGITVANLTAEGCGYSGLLVQDISYCQFSNIECRNNSQLADNGYPGIWLYASNNPNYPDPDPDLYYCYKNSFTNIRSSGPKQNYGIREQVSGNGLADYNRIAIAELSDNHAESLFVGAHSGIVNPPISAGGSCNLLDGSTHLDTLAGTVARGDIVVGNSTPKWAKKAKGTTGKLVGYDANDVVDIDPATLDVDKLDGSHASAFLGATAQAVDSDKIDGINITVGTTPPGSPGVGDLWVDTT